MIMADDFERLKIKEYAYWRLFLFSNQSYLGRTYLQLKRQDDVDFSELDPAEREEFFAITRKLKSALHELYQPARINYGMLGNKDHDLHIHIIPRYDSDREIEGIVFSDKNKGTAPWPYDRAFTIHEEMMQRIKNEIVRRM
jgi:diadenosine tetraphosphate (Ap4A) HIT family hydrolase